MDDYAEIGKFINHSVRREVADSVVSKNACCIGPNGSGGFTFRTGDGRTMSATIPLDSSDYKNGDWCTLERTSQGWIITGVGAYDGGPTPDAAEYDPS